MRRKVLTPVQALAAIAEIIEDVDWRCLSADGPVPPTREEITTDELRAIYRLATKRTKPPPPRRRATKGRRHGK